MANHYKKLRTVKSVVDSSPPTGYYDKIQNTRQSRPPSRAEKRRQSNLKALSSTSSSDRPPLSGSISHRSEIRKHDCTNRQVTSPASSRSQSLPPRPPTRRKPMEMPNPNQYVPRTRSSGPASKLSDTNMQRLRSARSQHSVRPAALFAYFATVTQDQPTKDASHIPVRDDSAPPTPAPRTSKFKNGKRDTSYKNSVSDHEYLQFSLRITEDIIRNDLYTNKEMRRVFNSHIEANRGRLDMDKMNQQIQNLCDQLNIPLDESQDDDMATRSQIRVQRQTVATVNCTCFSVPKSPKSELKDCECGSKRCLPFQCVKHNNNNNNTNSLVNESLSRKKLQTEKSDEEKSTSASLEDVIENQYYQHLETGSTLTESNDSLESADIIFNASSNSDLASFIKIRQSLGCIELPSLSRVTERTEPTSNSTLDNQTEDSDHNLDSGSGFETTETLPGFEELEKRELFRPSRQLTEDSLDSSKKFSSRKSISFNNKVRLLKSATVSETAQSVDDKGSSKRDMCTPPNSAVDSNGVFWSVCSFESAKLSQSMKMNEDTSISNVSETKQLANQLNVSVMTPQTSAINPMQPKEQETKSEQVSPSLAEREYSSGSKHSSFNVQAPLSEKVSGSKQSNLNEQELLFLPERGYISGASKQSSLNEQASLVFGEKGLNEQESRSTGSKKASLNERLSTPSGDANVESSSKHDILTNIKQKSCKRGIDDGIKSEFQVLQLKDLSNMKVYGPNNKQEEFVLFPGPIYVPKSSIVSSGINDLPNFTLITPQSVSVKATSLLKRDVVVSTDETPSTLGNIVIKNNKQDEKTKVIKECTSAPNHYTKSNTSTKMSLEEVESSTYSNLHDAALHTIHYPSYASSLSRAPPEVSQVNPPPVLDQFLSKDSKEMMGRLEQQPKVTLKNRYVIGDTDPYFLEQNNFLYSPAARIAQLNDYDLTPQRDVTSTVSSSDTIRKLDWQPELLSSSLFNNDALLLGDEYEIKDNFSTRSSNCSAYDNGLPQNISKFYPNISTQTQSSDWLPPPIKETRKFAKEKIGTNARPLKGHKQDSGDSNKLLKEHKKESDNDSKLLNEHKKENDDDIKLLKEQTKENQDNIKEHRKESDNNIKSLKEHKKESHDNIKLFKEQRKESDDNIKLLKENTKESHDNIKLFKEHRKESNNNIKSLKEHKKESDDNIKLLKEHKEESDDNIKFLKERVKESDDNIKLFKKHRKESNNNIKSLKEHKEESDDNIKLLKEYRKESDKSVKSLKEFNNKEPKATLKHSIKEPEQNMKNDEVGSNLSLPLVFQNFSSRRTDLKNGNVQKISPTNLEDEIFEELLLTKPKLKDSKEKNDNDHEESSAMESETQMESEVGDTEETLDQQLTHLKNRVGSDSSCYSTSESTNDADNEEEEEVDFYKTDAPKQLSKGRLPFEDDASNYLQYSDADTDIEAKPNDSMLKTVNEVITEKRNLRKTDASSDSSAEQKNFIFTSNISIVSADLPSDNPSYYEIKHQTELPFIEVTKSDPQIKSTSDDDDIYIDQINENDGKERTRCCGLIKAKKKTQKPSIHVEHSDHHVLNISSISDDQLLDPNDEPEMKLRRSTIGKEIRENSIHSELTSEFNSVANYEEKSSTHSEVQTVVSFNENVKEFHPDAISISSVAERSSLDDHDHSSELI